MKTLTPATILLLLIVVPLPAQGDVFVRAARAHLGTGEVIAPAVLHVSKGTIVAISTEMSLPAGATEIDLGEAVLTPGLVDGLSYAGLPRGIAENEEGTELTPRYLASGALDLHKDELGRLRQQGVTSLCVHPGSRNVVGGMICHLKLRGSGTGGSVVADRLGLRVTLGPDAARGNSGIGRGSPGIYSRLPNSRMGTIYLLRNAFTEALNYRERRALEPKPRRDPDLEIYLEVLDGKLPIFWQARSAKDINGACNVIREFKLKRNVIVDAWEAEHAADDLKSLDVPVLLGPLVHTRTHWAGRRDEGTRHSMAGPALLQRKGVRAAFSHGGWRAGETLMDSLRFAVRAGLSRKTAISWVTLEPARILGIDGKVGSLTAGKCADVVAWSADPLEATSKVNWVMIDGRILETEK